LRQLQYVIGAVLLRFFPLGRTSPATSPNSSNAATSTPPSTIPGVTRPVRRGERDDARGDEQYGAWGPVIRRLADGRPDRHRRVLTWPVREALLAFLDLARADAQREYDFARLMWAAAAAFGAGGDPPPLPPLLDD
jgi:hypothetical protein